MVLEKILINFKFVKKGIDRCNKGVKEFFNVVLILNNGVIFFFWNLVFKDNIVKNNFLIKLKGCVLFVKVFFSKGKFKFK